MGESNGFSKSDEEEPDHTPSKVYHFFKYEYLIGDQISLDIFQSRLCFIICYKVVSITNW